MRYTTLIDITEDAALYRNQHVRLLYLHMALKAGYHPDDLDVVRCSLRGLASAVGLTLSATRHALGQLEAAHLIERAEGGFMVKKWLQPAEPAKRGRSVATSEAKAIEQADQERAQASREEEAAQRLAMWAAGSNSWLENFKTQQRAAAGGDAAAKDFCERNAARCEREKAAARAAVEQFISDYNAARGRAANGDETARRWLARNRQKADALRAASSRGNSNKETQ